MKSSSVYEKLLLEAIDSPFKKLTREFSLIHVGDESVV